MECTCYVKTLSREQQFCLRYGAHALNCPKYRESGDVLDRKRDIETRKQLQEQIPELGWIRSTQGHNTLKQNFRRCMECKQGFHYGMDYSWVPVECPHCGTVSARYAK